jgi:hypothetical protein
VPAFEQMLDYAPGPSSRPASDLAAKAARVTQELRRTSAPRVRPAASEGVDEIARQRLEQRISAHLPGGSLALAITDNRYTIISVKRDRGPIYRLRLHHMFLDAPPELTAALARYVALNDSQASSELGSYIERNQTAIHERARRRSAPVVLETRGDVFDLQAVFDRLNARYFRGRIDARITWGARGGRPRQRTSIKMGSYCVEDRLIRIHPTLDRHFIPTFFLEWIVYHEMLHQVHDMPVVGGRRQFHTPAFLADEARFEHHELARAWERRNVDRLLTC